MAVGAIIIAAILIILSRGARYGGEAVIYLNGEEYARMPLEKADTLKIEQDGEKINLIESDGRGNVRMHSSTCKNQLCVEQGWLGADALYFTVEDNGGGVDETMLEQLRDILRSDEVNIEHNGLQNINRRIWLGYGGDSGLTIDSTEGEGFTVKLKLRLGGM